MPLQEKIRRGNIIVENSTTKIEMIQNCEKALAKFLKKVRGV